MTCLFQNSTICSLPRKAVSCRGVTNNAGPEFDREGVKDETRSLMKVKSHTQVMLFRSDGCFHGLHPLLLAYICHGIKTGAGPDTPLNPLPYIHGDGSNYRYR